MKSKIDRKNDAYNEYAKIRDNIWSKCMKEYRDIIEPEWNKYQAKLKEIDEEGD